MILMIWNPFGDFPREMGYPHRRGIVYSMKELINNVNLYNHKTDVFSSLYSFKKLNEKVKRDIQSREDVDVLFVNYNEILTSPEENIQKICDFLLLPDISLKEMMGVVDKRLYRQRR